MKCCACENEATKKVGPTRKFQIFNFCDECYKNFTGKDVKIKSFNPRVFNKGDVTSLSFELKMEQESKLGHRFEE